MRASSVVAASLVASECAAGMHAELDTGMSFEEISETVLNMTP